MSPTNTKLPSKKQAMKKKNRLRKKRSKKACDEEVPRSDPHNPSPQKQVEAGIQKREEIPQVESKRVKQKLPTHEERKKRKLSQEIQDLPLASFATSAEERPCYSFQVDDTDHCETPLEAWNHIQDILDRLAKSLNKTRSSLTIYDPYYCDGGVKKKLASIGFTSVINRNRDFYDDIAKETTPEYDVCVTNPPYSGIHMEKVLAFCSESSSKQKPFLLLLPHFVYTKDYYKRALSPKVSSSMFFLIPEVRYSYIPPAWVSAEKGSKALEQGKTKTAPFPSFWYCHVPKEMIPSNWLIQTYGPSGILRPKHQSKLRYAMCSNDIPRDFRGEFDPNNKRVNPRARKRAAKKRLEATSMRASARL
mmetsp:Transcript_3553/g.4708  ORF Transcript_3553/g.4708 Transcript_3553/m.4708 type:complete len:362 (+) Transcript_3553:107-1192(+)